MIRHQQRPNTLLLVAVSERGMGPQLESQPVSHYLHCNPCSSSPPQRSHRLHHFSDVRGAQTPSSSVTRNRDVHGVLCRSCPRNRCHPAAPWRKRARFQNRMGDEAWYVFRHIPPQKRTVPCPVLLTVDNAAILRWQGAGEPHRIGYLWHACAGYEVTSWKRRFWRMDAVELRYYKTDKLGQSPKGRISLTAFCVVKVRLLAHLLVRCCKRCLLGSQHAFDLQGVSGARRGATLVTRGQPTLKSCGKRWLSRSSTARTVWQSRHQR